MEKREWCYILHPANFDITCDKCGGTNITWSEYKEHIWCYNCKIDTKGNEGIFQCPIPIREAYLLGLNFDRFNLKTNQVERLNIEETEKQQELVYDPPEIWIKNDLQDKDFYGRKLKTEGQEHFKLVEK